MRDAGPDQGPHLTFQKKFVIIILENIKIEGNDMEPGKVYIIRNSINDKVYIGQTITPLQIRWKNHLSNAKNIDNPDNQNMIIYNAMRKHGIDNFYIELLEENIPREKLNEREAFWISKYNSVRPNGYNILDGENCPEPFRGKHIYQLNKNTLEIINSFNSESEAAEKLNIKADYISRVLRGVCITTAGYRWCKQEDYEKYKNNPPTSANGKNYYNKKTPIQLTKVILQIDPETNKVIKEWYNGANEAAKEVKKHSSGIYAVLNGKRKTCGGYIWRYKN